MMYAMKEDETGECFDLYAPYGILRYISHIIFALLLSQQSFVAPCDGSFNFVLFDEMSWLKWG